MINAIKTLKLAHKPHLSFSHQTRNINSLFPGGTSQTSNISGVFNMANNEEQEIAVRPIKV